MSKISSKQKLAVEIATATGLSPKNVVDVLDQLAVIAYREAVHDFLIPGICKIKVVTKKAAHRRNPFTGKTLLIGERQALKITPLKKAKDLITPNIGVTIQVLDDPIPPQPSAEPDAVIIDEPNSAPSPSPVAGVSPPPTALTASSPTEPNLPDGDEGQIVFPCSACGSILAAPLKSAGEKADCPYCNAPIQVPEKQSSPATNKKSAQPQAPLASDFILFSCKACHQEIEAPADMLGMDVECPSCGTAITVPLPGELPPPPQPDAEATATPAATPKANRSSMTIRIDLSDLE